jgi:hypothetical protein
MKRIFKLLLFSIAVCLFLGNCTTKEKENKNTLHYPSSKPYTRWWWFARTIEKEDIKAQLNWAKENNFGGVEIAWVYPLNRKRFYTEVLDTTYTPRQEWLSKEWSEIVAFTKRYAESIGIGCDFTFGTGWPFGDTYLSREDATQNYGEKNDSNKWTYVVVSWEYPKKGFILNHLDKNAFLRYADKMGGALKEALKGSKSGLFCDSWEVETHKLWTKGFDKEFEKRYGYDIKPFMDSIYSKTNADERYDYMKLLADYVLNQFYIPFTEECHKLGAFSRVQCAGAPIDLISGYAGIDVPETEAMLYEPGYSIIVASAACLGGKKEISSETFTCTYGFPKYNKETKKMDFKLRGKEQVADLKLIADALFANGVNQIFWHGMPFNPVGIDTICFYATVHVGKKGNLSSEIPAFNNYMQKVSEVMKMGKTYSDVAVYLPVEDSWIAGNILKPDAQQPWAWGEYEMRYTLPPAELKGYHPLWISGDYLKNAKVENKKLLCGDAVFSILYIDVDYIDIAALKRILEFAKLGLPVCLKKKPKQPGKNKAAEYDQLLKQLSSLANVSSDFQKIAVTKVLVSGNKLPDFWCRVSGDDYYLFFANPKAQNLHLPLTYGQSYSDKDVVIDINLNIRDNAIPVKLLFKPYQSLLLKVDKTNSISFIDISFVPKTPKTTAEE